MRDLVLSVVVPVYNEEHLVTTMLERLVAVEFPELERLEVILVDDASKDRSLAAIESFASEHAESVRVLAHARNQGKGAAVRTGIAATTGDLVVIQDADLEYDPRDLPRLILPFLEDDADAVYGSRFASGERRRVLYFRHELGNRFITFVSNLMTDLNLTDVETCYKMFRGDLLRSIPLRSNDFRFEVEITAKLAKRNAKVFEVPISYAGRTYEEGKKIGWRDGVLALGAILKYRIVDDSRVSGC